jgi:hypothetical protein
MMTFSLSPPFDQGSRQRARSPPVCPGVDYPERDVSLSRKDDPGRMHRCEADQRPVSRGGKEVVAGTECLGSELNKEVEQCLS